MNIKPTVKSSIGVTTLRRQYCCLSWFLEVISWNNLPSSTLLYDSPLFTTSSWMQNCTKFGQLTVKQNH